MIINEWVFVWTEKTTEAKLMKAGGTEIGKTLAEKSRGLFSANDWQCKTWAFSHEHSNTHLHTHSYTQLHTYTIAPLHSFLLLPTCSLTFFLLVPCTLTPLDPYILSYSYPLTPLHYLLAPCTLTFFLTLSPLLPYILSLTPFHPYILSPTHLYPCILSYT